MSGSTSNNPIHNTIKEVLGLGGVAPKTFKEKIDAFNIQASKNKPLIEQLAAPDLSRKLNLQKPIVVFDLETTGKVVNQDQIFDAFFLKINPDGTTEKFSKKLRPNVPLNPEAAKVTGASQAQLDKYTQTFADVAEDLKKFLKGSTLAGYNVATFDIPLLSAEFKRAGINIDLMSQPVVDVFNLAKARYPEQQLITGGTKLGSIYQKLIGKALPNAHRAVVDVGATVSVLKKLIQTSNIPTTIPELAKLSEIAATVKPPARKLTSASELFRRDTFSMLSQEGFQTVTGQGIEDLFQNLFSKGALPSEAKSVFANIRSGGGTLFFNPKTNALLLGRDIDTVVREGGRITELPVLSSMTTRSSPTPGSSKMVQIGTSRRTALSAVLVNQSKEGAIKYRSRDFLQLFYEQLSGRLNTTSTFGIIQTVEDVFRTEIPNIGQVQSLLGDPGLSKGLENIFVEGTSKANKFVLGFEGEYAYSPLFRAIQGYQTSDAALAMLTKTAGRSVYQELGLPKDATLDQTFERIKTLRENYLGSTGKKGELARALQSMGALEAVPYIKPEYLGRDRLTVGAVQNANFMARMFGTKFEPHVAVKGLFQLNKMALTTASQRAAMMAAGENYATPFLLKGQPITSEALNFGKLMKVAVAEMEDQAASMLYFGESGGYYTEAGERAFKSVLPKGTISITDPSVEMIGRVERLFGVNLGASPVQEFDFTNLKGIKFTSFDVEEALDMSIKTKDLRREYSKDIRHLIQKEKKYRGLFTQLASHGSDEQARLARVSLTPGNLTLDFVTAQAMTPNTISIISSGRRMTLEKMFTSNPFANIGNGVQFIHAADEFFKTHGQLSLIANYIGNIQELGEEQAAKEFKKVFKVDPHRIPPAKGNNKSIIIPIVEDADSAMQAVLLRLKEMQSGTAKEQKLFNQILKGVDVSTNVSATGVKSLRAFYTFAAARTDFMDDLNMLNPVRMTLNKMVTLSSGAAQLGYGPGEDPLFKIFAGMSNPWRRGHLQLTSRYGQLALGEKHWLTKFSKALVTPESVGNLRAKEVIRLGEDGKLYRKTKKGGEIALKDLPNDISQFKYGGGGVRVKDLEGTILDPNLLKGDMMYIDLGKNVKTNLLGGLAGQTKDYRYLPIPIKAMRLQGIDGNLTLSQVDGAYEMVEDLINLQRSGKYDPSTPFRYKGIMQSMLGDKGVLETTSDIMVSFGTRARFAPRQVMTKDEKVLRDFLLDPEELFTINVRRSEVMDYLSRSEQQDTIKTKKGETKRVVSRHNQVLEGIREAIDPTKGKGVFYAAVGVDPMQRAEHMNVMRIRVIDDEAMGASELAKRRIGQMNLAYHPLLPRMLERDLDKDVANLIPLEGMSIKGLTAEQTQKAFADRFAKQAKLAQHFQFFSYMQLKIETKKSVTKRLFDLFEDVKNSAFVTSMSDYLGQYSGTVKSLGYSITRGSESVMAALIDRGVEGAKELGLMEKGFTEESILKAISPYVEDGAEGLVRLDVAKKLMQNVYQGAVQKGTSKETLLTLAEDLIKIGQSYKGAKYNPDEAKKAATKAFEDFLMPLDIEGNIDVTAKNRMLFAMDYIAEKQIGGVTKESVEAFKIDLEKNNFQITDDVKNRFSGLFKQLNQATATILGDFFGTAMPIAASVRRSFSGAIGILQKTVREGMEFSEIAETIIGGAMGKPVDLTSSEYSPKPGPTLVDEMAEKAADAKKALQAEGKGLKASIKNFLGKGGGKFAAGLGVGAVLGAGIASMASGPEPMGPPPMPRDVDARQPMDYGPDISASSPRVYGNNQVFGTFRNSSPETFSDPPRYNFGAGNNTRMVMQDRSSVANPYVIEQQMKRVAYSDFNY